MYEIGTATPDHDTIGVGIGLNGRYSLREPTDREAGINGTYHPTFVILDGLAVAGHHLTRVRSHIEIEVRLRPAWLVEQRRQEIPVHEEILVVVATALNRTKAVADMLGVGREVTALVLEVVGFEGDGAVVEVRIVQQHAAAVDEH